MRHAVLIEIWDGFLFFIYNLVLHFKLWTFNPCVRKILKKNKVLIDKHKGQRCFILLNGPSLNNYDLSSLRDEITFCVNYFDRSEFFDVVKPTYHVITDNNYAKSLEDETHYSDFTSYIKKSNNKLILGYRFIDKMFKFDKVHFLINKKVPGFFGNASGLNSIGYGYANVSFEALSVAINMGFSEIYLLGLDFEPGVFKHFDKSLDAGDPKLNSKNAANTWYWGYTQAQVHSFYLAKYAEQKGVKVFNCNPKSAINAYPYKNFKDIGD